MNGWSAMLHMGDHWGSVVANLPGGSMIEFTGIITHLCFEGLG